MKVDYFGNVGEKGGVGNYSTKLFHALEKEGSVEMNHVELEWGFPILEMTFHNLFEIPYRIWRSDADVVHLTDQAKAGGLIFLPSSLTENVVVTVHDISPYINNYAGKFSQLISHLTIRGLKKASRILAISQFTKDELVENLNIDEMKIDVVYQGIDTDYFYPRAKNKEVLKKYDIEEPFILYVGSEIGRKNMEGVIRKFKELKTENTNLTLVKAGSAGRKKYRKKTKEHVGNYELNEGEDVVFVGYVDEEDLPQIYSSAEATLLWSHYEGFGRTVLESKACGTPVITKNEPPMNEWLPSESFEEEFNNPEPEEIFSWKKAAVKTRGIYQKVMNND